MSYIQRGEFPSVRGGQGLSKGRRGRRVARGLEQGGWGLGPREGLYGPGGLGSGGGGGWTLGDGTDRQQTDLAWVTNYITLLTNRKKWSKTKRNLEVDDLVLIVDDSLQRSAWEMGRVVQVDDGVAHARKIFVKRPNSKIICRDRTN